MIVYILRSMLSIVGIISVLQKRAQFGLVIGSPVDFHHHAYVHLDLGTIVQLGILKWIQLPDGSEFRRLFPL